MFAPSVELKIWGEVTHIFASDHAAVSLLKVSRGFRCSRHRHRHRHNMFAVQTGAILVETWEVLNGDKKVRMVSPGSTFSVPPGVWHRFNVIHSGRVVEVYWSEDCGLVCLDDIERERKKGSVVCGGPFDVKELLDVVERMPEAWGP